jgi:hypothetical protein
MRVVQHDYQRHATIFARLILEKDVGERLPPGVPDDEAPRSSTDQGSGAARAWRRLSGVRGWSLKLGVISLSSLP